MAFPVILSKLKSLTPVGVVGLAVAVTIKLLTQATPTNFQLLQVKADEDIMQVEEHREDLVEPEEEKKEEEEQEVAPVQEEEEAEVEEDSPEEENQGDGEAQQKDESEAEEQKKKQEEDEKKPESRTFKGSGPVIDIFKALLSPEK